MSPINKDKVNCGSNMDLLKARQGYSLGGKIYLTKERIIEWYEHWEGKVYVAFSGGRDSTVLLHIARQIYPNIKAVYVDTGLEYPEIKTFVRSISNVIWVRPKMPFHKVIAHYGWPIVSKEQAQYIQQYRNAKSEKTKDTRWNGNRWGRGKISEKWKYLINAPFKISEKCCDVMKKNPVKRYEKETGEYAMLGNMAVESSKRVQEYLRFGCNAFDAKRPVSKPLGFWLEKDIADYFKEFQIPYSEIYNMGYVRTGCMFCLFGHHISQREGNDRLALMKKTHPKHYKFCMKKLGMEEVLKWYPKKRL